MAKKVDKVAQIEAKIRELQASIPQCEHGQPEGRCPYCDKCEHGVGAWAHCEQCHINDDPAWKIAPVTESEIARAEKYFSTFHPPPELRRYTPHGKRNYHDTEVALMPLVFKEWREMKATETNQ